MKKIAIIIGLLLAFTSFVFAQDKKINIGFWGGYNLVGMKDMNDEVKYMGESTKATMEDGDLTGVKLTTKEIKSAFGGGIEATYEVIPNLKAGLRAGYLVSEQGKSEVNWKGTIMGTEYYVKQKVTLDGSLIPVLAGGKYSYSLGEKLMLNGGVFAGIGFANAKFKFAMETDIPGIDPMKFEVPMKNSAFNLDINVGLSYQISPAASIGLNAGYLLANISEMKATKDVDVDGDGDIDEDDVEKDDVMISTKDDSKVAFDFSGLSVGIAINIAF